MPLVSLNPATGRIIARYTAHTQAQREARLAAAYAAATHWRACAPAERARHLRKLAAGLKRERATLAALITAEMGKPLSDALAEVDKCSACCLHYARYGASLIRAERPAAVPDGVSVHYEPLGVVLAIMPWNFPLWQVIRAAVPALVAGNVILLKHASNVTGCAQAFCAVATRAGLPSGVLDYVLASGKQIEPLIADPRIAGVTLTGSTAAGRRVAALAGAALKPVGNSAEATPT